MNGQRGQLQSMETIIIAVILIFLVILGAVFYATSSQRTVQRAGLEAQLVRLDTLAKKLHYLPDLSCPNYGASKTPCIDLIKAELMGSILNNPTAGLYDPDARLDYYSLFGDSMVKVEVLYPQEQEIILFNATTGGNVVAASVPVSVFDPISNQRMLGRLYAELD